MNLIFGDIKWTQTVVHLSKLQLTVWNDYLAELKILHIFVHKSITKLLEKVVNFPIHPQNNHSQMSVFALIDYLLSVYLSVCALHSMLFLSPFRFSYILLHYISFYRINHSYVLKLILNYGLNLVEVSVRYKFNVFNELHSFYYIHNILYWTFFGSIRLGVSIKFMEWVKFLLI